MNMAGLEKESVESASSEISREFRTLVDSKDLDSIKQSQNLMYVYVWIGAEICCFSHCIDLIIYNNFL